MRKTPTVCSLCNIIYRNLPRIRRTWDARPNRRSRLVELVGPSKHPSVLVSTCRGLCLPFNLLSSRFIPQRLFAICRDAVADHCDRKIPIFSCGHWVDGWRVEPSCHVTIESPWRGGVRSLRFVRRGGLSGLSGGDRWRRPGAAATVLIFDEGQSYRDYRKFPTLLQALRLPPAVQHTKLS